MPVTSCAPVSQATRREASEHGLIADIRSLLRDESLSAPERVKRIESLLSEAEKPVPPGGMLVISRHEGEWLQIGSNVLIGFGGMKGAEGRLLIRAPRCVNVVRTELLE